MSVVGSSGQCWSTGHAGTSLTTSVSQRDSECPDGGCSNSQHEPHLQTLPTRANYRRAPRLQYIGKHNWTLCTVSPVSNLQVFLTTLDDTRQVKKVKTIPRIHPCLWNASVCKESVGVRLIFLFLQQCQERTKKMYSTYALLLTLHALSLHCSHLTI